jgi:hypothetical protein
MTVIAKHSAVIVREVSAAERYQAQRTRLGKGNIDLPDDRDPKHGRRQFFR